MDMPNPEITDALGRRATYLRISVTDRCNLRCVYCVNSRRQSFIPHGRILRFEEFLRLIGIAQKLGIQKVRITGGEPFARRGLMDFLDAIRNNFPALRLCVTTNGTLLRPHLAAIPALGISSFNISVDTFEAQTFASLSGGNHLAEILANIEGLLARGQRVKINVVALRGITEPQIPKFLEIIKRYPLDLRFIEFMPIGSNTAWNEKNFIACEDLKREAQKYAALLEAPSDGPLSGPAQIFNVAGAAGRLGFISAVSEHFCGRCNRLRLTSEGALRTCLFSDREYKLAKLMRNPKISDCHIAQVIHAAMRHKPLGRDLLAMRQRTAVAARQMVGIGG